MWNALDSSRIASICLLCSMPVLIPAYELFFLHEIQSIFVFDLFICKLITKDYNIFGMDFVHLSKAKFRERNIDVREIEQSRFGSFGFFHDDHENANPLFIGRKEDPVCIRMKKLDGLSNNHNHNYNNEEY